MTKCQGCSETRADVSAYHVRFTGVRETQVALYCDPCAELAEMNWTGEIESVVPVGSDKALA
jgi:hypothetical protein